MTAGRILVTLEAPSMRRSFLLRGRITHPTAEWIGQALIRGAEHPLSAHLPVVRYATMAIHHQGRRWRITYSRQKDPVYLQIRGRPVIMAEPAPMELWLEEVEDLAITARPSTKDSQCAETPPKSSTGLTPRP